MLYHGGSVVIYHGATNVDRTLNSNELRLRYNSSLANVLDTLSEHGLDDTTGGGSLPQLADEVHFPSNAGGLSFR